MISRNNNMKLIMENWRRFTQSDDVSIIIESKEYNGSLIKLTEQLDSKKISKKTYNKIILESIDKDFKDLDFLLSNKQILNELAAFDAAKKAVKGAVDSILEKINSIFIKAISLIKTNAKKAFEMVQKVINYVNDYLKNNPELQKKLLSALKIAAGLAIVFIVLNPGDAHAYIELPGTSARSATTLGADTASGKQMIDFLTNHGKQVIDSLGLNSSIIDNIIAAIKSKDPIKVGEGVTNILQQIRAMAERTEFMDQFKPLVDQAVNTASNLGDHANSAISYMKDLGSPDKVADMVKDYMKDKNITSGEELTGTNAGNVVRHALQKAKIAVDAKTSGSLAFKNLQQSVELALQQAGKLNLR